MSENVTGLSSTKKSVDKTIFYVSAGFTVLFLAYGIIFPGAFNSFIENGFMFSVEYFGWLFSLVVLIGIIAAVVIGFGKAGSLKLGGAHSKPDIKTWDYFAMCAMGTIGIGIFFWSVGEPMMHYMSPPPFLGIEGGTPESAIASLQLTFGHWILPWAFYSITGIAIGHAHYNLGLPFKPSSGLYPIIGDKIYGWFGKVVDIVSVIAILAGIASAFGFGVLASSAGISIYTGISSGPLLWLGVALVVGIAFTISCLTGVMNGIRRLSDINLKYFLVLMVFLIIAGPYPMGLLKLWFQAFGGMVYNLIPTLTMTDPFSVTGGWVDWWPVFYWAYWIAWIPILGMWVARISRGRTFREIVIYTFILPGLFTTIWFTVWGGNAILFERLVSPEIYEVMSQLGFGEEGLGAGLYAFLQRLPLSALIIPVTLIAALIAGITLMDSSTNIVSMITSKGLTPDDPEPMGAIKVFWAAAATGLTVVFLSVGAVFGLKTAALIVSAPVAIYFIALVLAIRKFVPDELKAAQVSPNELEAMDSKE